MNSYSPSFLLNRLVLGAVISLLFASCGSNCPVVQDEEALKAYANLLPSSASTSQEVDQVAVYLDYSNGMHGAIDQSYGFFQEVINILDRRDALFFKVGLGEPVRINEDIFEPQSTFNPRNPNYFSEKRSYLKQALSQIVAQTDRQSVFITDFERVPDPNQLPRVQYYDGKEIRTNIDFSPWATKEFESWLTQGGSIDIFAHPFRELNQQELRYLYFLVFTPAALVGAESPESVFFRMQEAGYTQNQGPVAWLGFSLGRFKGERGYEPEEVGGINPMLAPGLSAFGQNWDYYQMNFADLLYLNEYGQPGEEQEMDSTFFNGLEIRGEKSSFGKPEVGLKAGVASVDFQNFLDAYYMDSLAMYQPSGLPEAKSIFVLTENEGRVGIGLDPDYLGMETSCELYRLEIWLNDALLEMDEARMKRYLQWTDNRGDDVLEVTSLYQSIREAMRRQTFSSRRIHTLYLELIN